MLAANVCTARVPRAAQAPGALPRPRGTDAGEARRAARFPRELRAVAAGRRRPDGVRLRAAAAADQGSARLRAAADGAAALAAAGAVPPGQRRPLRPLLRGVRALHLADPPLSRSARAPRDQGGAREQREYKPSGASWAELGVHCSLTERRADDATRDVENWLKCYFMQDQVGETFDGTISGVTSFGIFVTLDGLNIDGLVHVTELGRDYFHFDAARHALIGERSGRVFQLAGSRPRQGGARRPRDDQDRFHACRRGVGRVRQRRSAQPVIQRAAHAAPTVRAAQGATLTGAAAPAPPMQ